MPITVVGSIAFDAVKTPFGERERMLGGAAVHFALAARMFDDVRIVGPVGEDFDDAYLAMLIERGIDVHDVQQLPGETFFWRGQYGWDLNARETLETRLGVFADFEPELSERARSSDVLFLANIQPEVQLSVREQLPDARFVAMDSMNLWIETAREPLVEVVRNVDCVILNDSELRQLTERPSLVAAARDLLAWRQLIGTGPRIVVAKQGEFGAALVTQEGFFSLPAYPLESVVDPTGAGDTFAGGLLGYIAAHPGAELDDQMLRRAMAYATVLASFNVEKFGAERLLELDPGDLVPRIEALRGMTEFSAGPHTRPA